MSGRVDAPRLLKAAKTTLAILVGYWLALRFGWKGSSVVVTIVILQTADWGSTLTKAGNRLLGTLAGAVFGVWLAAVCGADREPFILGMALLTGFCVWSMQTSSRPYAWQLVLLTAAIVGWPSASDPTAVFQTAVDRLTAVVMGVVLSGFSEGVFLPTSAFGRFKKAALGCITGCQDLLASIGEALGDPSATETLSKRTASLLSLATSLDSELDAAGIETTNVRSELATLRRLALQLNDLVLLTIRACDAAAWEAQRETERRAVLASALSDLAEECSKLAGRLRDALDSRGTGAKASAASMVSIGETPSRIAFQSDRTLAEAISEIDVTLGVLQSTRSTDAQRPPSPSGARGRFWKSMVATFQVLVAACFVVSFNWPMGFQTTLMLVMILSFVNAKMPVALVARPIARGVLLALPVAALFHFFVMSRVDGFAELAPLLALLFLPFLYRIANPYPLVSLEAMLAILFVNSLIGVSGDPPTYAFAPFFNTYLGMSGGVGAAFLLAYVAESRNPRRGFAKLLASMLLESADRLDAIDRRAASRSAKPLNDGGDSPDSQRSRHARTDRWLKARKLFAVSDVRRDPPEVTAGVLAAMSAVTLLLARLPWEDGPEEVDARADVDAQADWIELLRTTAQRMTAVGASRGVTTVDRRKMEASYLGASVADCHERITAVDWARWSSPRF